MDNENIELWLCPYCDGTPTLELSSIGKLYIHCAGCELDFGHGKWPTKEKLAEEWNEWVKIEMQPRYERAEAESKKRVDMIKTVKAVDYQGDYAYARGSIPAVVNLANLDFAVLIPPKQTRSVFDNITRLHFNDGTHMDVFGKPEDFAS